MKNKTIYAFLPAFIFTVFAIVNSAQAATETIAIEHHFNVRCSVDHENVNAETTFALPLEGRPYKLENVQVEELDRYPSRYTMHSDLGGNYTSDNHNYYGTQYIDYLPSRENVERVRIWGYAKRARHFINFGPLRSIDSVLKLKLKFQFSHEAPVDAISQKLKVLADALESQAPSQIESLNETIAELLELRNQIPVAGLKTRLVQARDKYSLFVCPILAEVEDLHLQAIKESGAESRLATNAELFTAALKSKNNDEITQNIIGALDIIGIQSNELRQPICSTYYAPVTTGFYRAQNTPTVYQFCEGNYCHVTNPDTMNCLGGFGQVVEVSQPKFEKIVKNRTNTGFARFNGFIRQSKKCEIYKLYNNDFYCHVINSVQMYGFGGFGQVKEVSDKNNLLTGLTFTGACQ